MYPMLAEALWSVKTILVKSSEINGQLNQTKNFHTIDGSVHSNLQLYV